MPVTVCDDRDPSTCDLLALPPPEVCNMAVRTLALYQAATELATVTLGAFLATALCTDAAGADRPTVTMKKPSAWREHQEKAQKYAALRRRKRKEKRLRAARAPVVDASPKRASKTFAAPKKRRSQQTPRRAPMSKPAAPALSELVARKGLSRKEKKKSTRASPRT